MTVATWPDPEVPVARLRLLFLAGAAYEPVHLSGLASLAGPLLRAANRRRPLDALERLVESMGTDVVTEVEWESASMTLDVLAGDVEPALDLLIELASCPAFPQEAVDALRARRLAQLRRHGRDAAVLATDGLFAELFPGTRYGVPLLGSADELATVSRDDIAAFHAERYTAPNASLVVTGGADPASVLARVEGLAARLGAARNERPPDAAPRAESPTRRVVVVDCPDARRTELRVGRRSVDQAHPDALALQVLGTLLGGTSFSRLSHRLRRAGGYCYHVHGRFVLRRRGGAFLVSANVPTAAAGSAAGDILREIEALPAAPIGLEETVAARGQVEATLVQSWGCVTGQADRLAYVLANDLQGDYFERCLDAVRAVSPDRLMELSRRHLSGEQIVVVAAGPAKQLREQLGDLTGVLRVRESTDAGGRAPMRGAPESNRERR